MSPPIKRLTPVTAHLLRCAPLAHTSRTRVAMTLVELMIAMTLMACMTGVLATLALAMRQGWEHNAGHALAAQHARVALERISRAVSTAMASEDHPGFFVVYETVSSDRFPDTLVVWTPTGAPSNASGPPLISECTFYCPDPAQPNRLLEITAPTDNRTIPLTDVLNTTAWRATIAGVKTANSSKRTVLTDMLRTASPTSPATMLRGAVRFMPDLRPSVEEWDNPSYGWFNLSWPQHLFSQDFGVRQAWVRIELQMMPSEAQASGSSADRAVPFFGSAVLVYTVQRVNR